MFSCALLAAFTIRSAAGNGSHSILPLAEDTDRRELQKALRGGERNDQPGEPAGPAVTSEIAGGVVFSLTSNQETYGPGETLHLRYTASNTTDASAVYNFSLGCMYELIVFTDAGDTIYHHALARACPLQPSRLNLEPHEDVVRAFPPIVLPDSHSDVLATAGLRGYPETRVTLRVGTGNLTGVTPSPEPAASEAPGTAKVLSYSHRDHLLTLRLKKEQHLSVSAYVLNGQKIGQLSRERFFASGVHTFSLKSMPLGEGILIVRVRGKDFVETETISLAQ